MMMMMMMWRRSRRRKSRRNAALEGDDYGVNGYKVMHGDAMGRPAVPMTIIIKNNCESID